MCVFYLSGAKMVGKDTRQKAVLEAIEMIKRGMNKEAILKWLVQTYGVSYVTAYNWLREAEARAEI